MSQLVDLKCVSALVTTLENV